MPTTEPAFTIHVGIVSPPSLLREGLAAVLRREPDFVLHVSDNPQAPANELRNADALVVDGTERDWSAAVGAAEQGGVPSHKMLVMCKVGTGQEAAELLALDVAGHLLPDELPETAVERVRSVARGDWRASRRDFFRLMGQRSEGTSMPLPLSKRERDTLHLVAAGFGNARIADELFLAHGTVRNLVSALYRKLGVRSRGEAVLWAWRHGLGASD